MTTIHRAIERKTEEDVRERPYFHPLTSERIENSEQYGLLIALFALGPELIGHLLDALEEGPVNVRVCKGAYIPGKLIVSASVGKVKGAWS